MHARRPPTLLLPFVLALATTLWAALDATRTRDHARHDLLPEIRRLADTQRYDRAATRSWRAVALVAEARRSLGPNDPDLEDARRGLGTVLALRSTPPGATLRARPYGDPDAPWVDLGRTPLDAAFVPDGLSQVEVTLEGHRTVRDLLWAAVYWGRERRFVLDPARPPLPVGMTRVAAEPYPLQLPGLDQLPVEPMADFLIDRYETTNAEFARFVEAGGYTRRALWRHPFRTERRMLSFEEAMARFVDRSGQPGPATWSAGTWPAGQGDLPVGGLSWYEAAAYAAFVEKELPTVFHWTQVAFPYGSSEIVPRSNFGDGPLAARSASGENRHGAHHLAGNAREWCSNASLDWGARFLLGGGWDDPPCAFNTATAADPFDRSATNGVRCMRLDRGEPNREALARPLEAPRRDFAAERETRDAAFARFLELFAYEPGPLHATVEAQEPYEAGLRQVVSFDAAGGAGRVRALLFLPTGHAPPLPTVLLFPSSGALHTRSSDGVTPDSSSVHAALLASGRAVMLPVYSATFEHAARRASDFPDPSLAYRDLVVTWARELARSIDYLASRPDVDAGRLAFLGTSWGGTMGAILPAVEPRLRCNVLCLAGMLQQHARREVEQVTFVGHVTQPTLMLSGELDFYFPLETSQRPLFELLGTPPEHKRHVLYPGSHSLPHAERDAEILAWLDRYLGPAGPGAR